MSDVERRAMVRAVRLSEAVMEMLRAEIGRAADRLQFQLRVIEARLDPDAKRWVDDVRAAAADGSLLRRLEGQRSIESILDEWHRPSPA